MAQETRRPRQKVVNRTARPRRPGQAHARSEPAATVAPPAGPPRAALDAARRVGESFLVAIVTSTGLYLVGMVYIGAYYGRMSIEATALDFSPPFITLQAIHVLPRLLEYPMTLLFFWIVYRTFNRPARHMVGWLMRIRQRLPRLGPVVGNLVVIAPLVIEAFLATIREPTTSPDSIIGEVADMLGNAALILLIYAIWLGWSQRAFIVSQIRARRVLPIALVFLVYLLNALASTSEVAEQAAVVFMTGSSDNSMGITLTPKAGEAPDWTGRDLVLVTLRQSTYFVVERQPEPPAQRPIAWMIPTASVESARVYRLNDADITLENIAVDLE